MIEKEDVQIFPTLIYNKYQYSICIRMHRIINTTRYIRYLVNIYSIHLSFMPIPTLYQKFRHFDSWSIQIVFLSQNSSPTKFYTQIPTISRISYSTTSPTPKMIMKLMKPISYTCKLINWRFGLMVWDSNRVPLSSTCMTMFDALVAQGL